MHLSTWPIYFTFETLMEQNQEEDRHIPVDPDDIYQIVEFDRHKLDNKKMANSKQYFDKWRAIRFCT
jgi:hypothetical protein